MEEFAVSFRYETPPLRVFAGPGALESLPAEMERIGARRALIVAGHSVTHKTGLVTRIRQLLGPLFAGGFDGVKRNSPLDAVLAGVEEARRVRADAIIAVGGGSTLVTARAITILLAEKGSPHELATWYEPGKPPVRPQLLEPKLPSFVVLTTPTNAVNRAGTAVQDSQRRRLEYFDPKTLPVATFIDADALLTSPTQLYLATAVAAFTRLAEVYQAPEMSALSHGDLKQALDLYLTCLPQLLHHPTSPEVRIQLAVAAVLLCRSQDGVQGGTPGVARGLVHGLLRFYESIDQGSACAVLTVPGMRFNREVLARGQARLAQALGAAEPGMSPLEAADAAAEAMSRFLQSLGFPTRLRDLGVAESDFAAIAEGALEDHFLHRNPRPVRDAGELVQLLREAF